MSDMKAASRIGQTEDAEPVLRQGESARPPQVPTATDTGNPEAVGQSSGAWYSELPPRVRQAVESVGFAITLKAGDMDALSAVNLARDGEIIARELKRQIAGRKVRP